MFWHKEFADGFEYIEVANAAATAKIALQGAHIFEYTPKGEMPLLWLSEKAVFEKGVAIRGGIPICWPRFGSLDESMMQHGFARIFSFELIGIKEPHKSLTELHLRLCDSQESRALWDHAFVLDVKIKISERLSISLETKNLDEKPLKITQALHTYFKVSQIENIRIKGLENRYYFDTLLDQKHKESQSIVVDKEIDRVYVDTDDEVVLIDAKRKIKLQTVGSASTVVWNPWIEKCAKMSYMSPHAYKEFICIESANAFDDFVMIKSKKSHTLELTISF